VAATELERQIAAIASLDDPVRRGLYLYVSGRGGEVGRDEAARAVRISRALAAFHLDKLVQHGLLVTSYRRLTKRRGPGAGRPAKLYRRADRQLDVTLPPRRYELAGRVLATALTDAPPAVRRALWRAARDAGRRLAERAEHERRGGASRATRSLAHVSGLLARCGYEPVRRKGELRLANCPFGTLAVECQPLVCETNLALVRGVLAGLGTGAVRARLRPQPGSCCVMVYTPGRKTR
jgi:predicted ArsR family transcriptional regulator